jgi:cephalosporin hydroxylase
MPAETPETSSAVPYPLLMSIQQGTMEYRYRRIPTLKNPFDIAIYPLLLEEARPRTLIEIGSHKGGSAVWFADMGASLGLSMHVYSVDLAKVTAVSHPSVTFLEGDARKLADTFADQFLADLPRPWLVIEDADHHYQTTLEVLRFFDHRLVAGEYLVVEDGILSDMLVAGHYAGGPGRAIDEFLRASDGRYAIDRRYCDYFGRNVTWNVDGYLRRQR